MPVAAAPKKLSIMSCPAEVAQALTLAGRLLYQAGKVPAWISLMTESREAELSISSYQEAGTAVSRTVRIEVGTLMMAIGTALAEGLASWAMGEARATVMRERVARRLNCILVTASNE